MASLTKEKSELSVLAPHDAVTTCLMTGSCCVSVCFVSARAVVCVWLCDVLDEACQPTLHCIRCCMFAHSQDKVCT